MIYLYKCNACHTQVDSEHRDDTLGPCDMCEQGELRRRYQVAFEPLMHAHFNHSVGHEVSDMRQYRSDLRDAGDKYTERTGMPVDYQPLSQGEVRGMMTMEGMDSTNRERMSRGLPAIEV